MKYRSLTYIYIFYEVNLHVTLIHYPKYDLHPSNNHQDIRQTHWTMKYRLRIHICFMRPTFVLHWSIIPNIIFLHQTVFKILSKIPGPCNIFLRVRKCHLTWGAVRQLSCMTSVGRFWRHFWRSDVISHQFPPNVLTSTYKRGAKPNISWSKHVAILAYNW